MSFLIVHSANRHPTKSFEDVKSWMYSCTAEVFNQLRHRLSVAFLFNSATSASKIFSPIHRFFIIRQSSSTLTMPSDSPGSATNHNLSVIVESDGPADAQVHICFVHTASSHRTYTHYRSWRITGSDISPYLCEAAATEPLYTPARLNARNAIFLLWARPGRVIPVSNSHYTMISIRQVLGSSQPMSNCTTWT